MRRLCFLIVVGLLVGSVPAQAHKSASSSSSLHRPRYAACGTLSNKSSNKSSLTSVWCAGINHAVEGLLKALELPPLSPDKNNSKLTRPAHAAAIAAVYFNITRAIPALESMLSLKVVGDRTTVSRRTHLGMTVNSLRAEAAYALAHLGATQATAEIGKLVVEFETVGHGSLWIETLEALAVLDSAAAADYATDFLGRATRFKTSMPGGTSKVKALDLILRADHTAALPMLRKRTTKKSRESLPDQVFCRFMAARIQLGDSALHKKTRQAMLGSYSGTWMATCDNKLVLSFGAEAADASVLIRHLGRPDGGLDHGVTNGAYGRLLHLLATSRFAPRKEIRKAFSERASWPHVADPTARTFVAHYPIYNDAGLAALGDNDARKRLIAVIGSETDESGLPWLASYWALRLKLRGAKKASSALFLRAGVSRNGNRSGVYRNLRTRVLEAYLVAFPKSSAWTALLVNADSNTAERALYHLSRIKPSGACRPAIGAAYKTNGQLTDPAAEFGLLALTALGTRCLGELERMAKDAKAPLVARGAALEIAAALGSKHITKFAAALKADDERHPAVSRALELAAAYRASP